VASVKIVVPCYNEEERLQLDTFRRFHHTTHDIRFLFVNDGSQDGTLRLLESLSQYEPTKYTLLSLKTNVGKAEAVRQGILTALTGEIDYAGFWDADLATPLETIPEFLDLAESRPELEIIIGARVKLLGRRIERRAFRHYLGRIFATAASVLLKLPVYDTQCGAKLFRVSSSTSALFEEPFVSKWIFDVEILARLIRERRGTMLPQPECVIHEYPLSVWRDVPNSKLSYADFVRACWELARIYERYFVKY
jgi:dolichyl-phosphate beta-glucosyltransferase